MSFDLFVWYEPWTMTGEDARAKWDRADDTDDYSAFIPHANVTAFHTALLTHFPALESLDDKGMDESPWSMTPEESDRQVVLNIRFSASDDVFRVVNELAEQYGLVILDPQDNTLYLPGPPPPSFSLKAGKGRRLTDPEPDVVTHRVRKALEDGQLAILEREPGVYVQAGSGPSVGMYRAGYAVELRLGSADEYYRYEVYSVDSVLAVFDDFIRNDEQYRTRLPWRKVNL